MLISAVAAIIALLALGISLVAVWVSWSRYEPLGEYSNPARILNRLPGIEGPALHVGDVLKVAWCRCTNEAVMVTVVQHFESVDQTPEVKVSLAASTQVRNPGCESSVLAVSLPEGVTTGRWVFRVQEIATEDSKTQIEAAISESFLVVARP